MREGRVVVDESARGLDAAAVLREMLPGGFDDPPAVAAAGREQP